MIASDVREAAENLYKVRLTNEPEACIELFHPEGILRIAGEANVENIPDAAEGRPAIDVAVRTLVADWRWLELDLKSVVVEGQQAAVRYDVTVMHGPTGETLALEVMDHIRFDENFAILEFVEFLDTARVAALGAGPG
ncbi:MAG: nuclear transport factor 2 family protein [Acidobacteriota bacterium]